MNFIRPDYLTPLTSFLNSRMSSRKYIILIKRLGYDLNLEDGQTESFTRKYTVTAKGCFEFEPVDDGWFAEVEHKGAMARKRNRNKNDEDKEDYEQFVDLTWFLPCQLLVTLEKYSFCFVVPEVEFPMTAENMEDFCDFSKKEYDRDHRRRVDGVISRITVSYTHLTLPTKA